ncbi:hypothetical protein C8R45DRAFT_1217163 [Mycena sanguinolenta]|nr:hypothetical protein C8R45DRAFT_1217163 [Mycena sanguinolenta]
MASLCSRPCSDSLAPVLLPFHAYRLDIAPAHREGYRRHDALATLDNLPLPVFIPVDRSVTGLPFTGCGARAHGEREGVLVLALMGHLKPTTARGLRYNCTTYVLLFLFLSLSLPYPQPQPHARRSLRCDALARAVSCKLPSTTLPVLATRIDTADVPPFLIHLTCRFIESETYAISSIPPHSRSPQPLSCRPRPATIACVSAVRRFPHYRRAESRTLLLLISTIVTPRTSNTSRAIGVSRSLLPARTAVVVVGVGVGIGARESRCRRSRVGWTGPQGSVVRVHTAGVESSDSRGKRGSSRRWALSLGLCIDDILSLIPYSHTLSQMYERYVPTLPAAAVERATPRIPGAS